MIVWFADFFRDYRVKPDNDKWNGKREFLSEESVFHATDGISKFRAITGEIMRSEMSELIIIAIANERAIGLQIQNFGAVFICSRSCLEGGIVEYMIKYMIKLIIAEFAITAIARRKCSEAKFVRAVSRNTVVRSPAVCRFQCIAGVVRRL